MDKIDIKILTYLLNNCRTPDRQIGKNVGISGGAVKSRIKKMIDNKVIEDFTLKIEPPVLGYSVLYFVVVGKDLKNVLEQVRLIGEPFFVVPCVGGITVCSIAWITRMPIETAKTAPMRLPFLFISIRVANCAL